MTALPEAKPVHFLIPGDLATPTGGYGYDRRVLEEFAAREGDLRHVALPEGFPAPDAEARAAAVRALAEVPDGGIALVDGLAFGALPEVMADHARRLVLVALVHHPLGDERGLDLAAAKSLHARERAALKHARGVVCTSEATAARLASAFGVAPRLITVALPGTEPGPRAAGGGRPPVILSLGSLIPRKRHDVLIAALARIRDRAWRAQIIGSDRLDPECARALKAQVAEAGLGARIAFEGAVVDARAELGRADIFALASEYEGYGMAFAEALSQGLPVVACRSRAVAALVPEAAGAVVAPGDPVTFAGALGRLLDDPGHRAACAEAAFQAGARLPRWADTCAMIAGALAAAAKA